MAPPIGQTSGGTEPVCKEIDVKDQTLWAGQALISSAQTFTYQTGDAASENISVATTVSASALSVSATSTLTVPLTSALTLAP